ncbi:MAG: hypothetical protein HKN23_13190 [Verrucomicrobiales bacterium]|nr:hypothetical protein [Verrucomicrobiales bacterium]
MALYLHGGGNLPGEQIQEPAPDANLPAGLPETIVAEPQAGKHSSALHAMNSIYRAYQLDPVAIELRSRLGIAENTDAIFGADRDGAVDPGVLQVFWQDGFTARIAALQRKRGFEEMRDHLESGHPVMALIQQKENEALHWVILSGFSDNLFQISDSLLPGKTVSEPARLFTDEKIVNAILVKPAPPLIQSAVSKLGKRLIKWWGVVEGIPGNPVVFFTGFCLLQAVVIWLLLSRIIFGGVSFWKCLGATFAAAVATILILVGIDLAISGAWIGGVIGILASIYVSKLVLAVNFNAAALAYLLSLATMVVVVLPFHFL